MSLRNILLVIPLAWTCAAGSAAPSPPDPTLLEQAIRRGARADVAAFPEFESLGADARFVRLAAKGLENQLPVAPPEVFLVVEDTSVEPEGISYDPDSARLFIGSLKGEIWQVDMQKRLVRFAGADSGLREVLGLKVDRKRRLLWVATGVFPDPFAAEPKKDSGLTGVMSFRLADGRRASECRIDKVIQDARMSFPNGIALSADETRLYVAHVEGLSVIDLKTRARTRLAVPENTAVNSMDGLVRDDADLIGIQPSPDFYSVAGAADPLATGGGQDRRARILRVSGAAAAK